MPTFIHAISFGREDHKRRLAPRKFIPCNVWINTDNIAAVYAEGLERFAIIKDAADDIFQVEGRTCNLDTALDKLHDSEYAKMMQNKKE